MNTTHSLTIQFGDGVTGNASRSKVINGLTFAGILAQDFEQPTIGLAALTGLAAAASTTGGTLAAGSYYYKVTALNAAGETAGSTEVSVTTTGSTGSVSLTWNAPGNPATQPITGYRIYRGTSAGGESVYFTSTTNSFTDTGAAGTAGTVPSSNTTGTSWTPPLAITPVKAFYFRNLSTINTATLTWTPTGGSSVNIGTFGPQDELSFLQSSAAGIGISALTIAVSTPGTQIELILGA